MTETSLAAIEKIVTATAKSKEEADKAIKQFGLLDKTSSSLFEKLFDSQLKKGEPC